MVKKTRRFILIKGINVSGPFCIIKQSHARQRLGDIKNPPPTGGGNYIPYLKSLYFSSQYWQRYVSVFSSLR